MMLQRLAFFVAFFLLFYFEPVEMFGTNFATVWKASLLPFALLLIFAPTHSRPVPALTFTGLLYAGQSLLNPTIFSNAFVAIADATKNTFIPATFGLFRARPNPAKIPGTYKFSVQLAACVVASTIPFHLGVLEPLASGYDLSLFGEAGSGFVGIFQTSHAASITIATAVILLAFEITRSRGLSQVLLYGLVALGLYSIFLTYARTGLLVAAVGLLVLMSTRPSKTRLITAALFLGALAIAAWGLYEYSSVFRMRVLGINIFTQDTAMHSIGSGRERFWVAALQNFADQDLPTMFFGMGSERAKDLMRDAVGMRIYAHNGFIDILQFNGVLGLTLYITFLSFVFREIHRAKHTALHPLASAMLFAYLAQMMVQGERLFLADILFGLVLAACASASELPRRVKRGAVLANQKSWRDRT